VGGEGGSSAEVKEGSFKQLRMIEFRSEKVRGNLFRENPKKNGGIIFVNFCRLSPYFNVKRRKFLKTV